jgi:hypothetical protein
LRHITGKLQGGTYEMHAQYVAQVPIPSFGKIGLADLANKAMTSSVPEEVVKAEREINELVEDAFGLTEVEKGLLIEK